MWGAPDTPTLREQHLQLHKGPVYLLLSLQANSLLQTQHLFWLERTICSSLDISGGFLDGF